MELKRPDHARFDAFRGAPTSSEAQGTPEEDAIKAEISEHRHLLEPKKKQNVDGKNASMCVPRLQLPASSSRQNTKKVCTSKGIDAERTHSLRKLPQNIPTASSSSAASSRPSSCHSRSRPTTATTAVSHTTSTSRTTFRSRSASRAASAPRTRLKPMMPEVESISMQMTGLAVQSTAKSEAATARTGKTFGPQARNSMSSAHVATSTKARSVRSSESQQAQTKRSRSTQRSRASKVTRLSAATLARHNRECCDGSKSQSGSDTHTLQAFQALAAMSLADAKGPSPTICSSAQPSPRPTRENILGASAMDGGDDLMPYATNDTAMDEEVAVVNGFVQQRKGEEDGAVTTCSSPLSHGQEVLLRKQSVTASVAHPPPKSYASSKRHMESRDMWAALTQGPSRNKIVGEVA